MPALTTTIQHCVGNPSYYNKARFPGYLFNLLHISIVSSYSWVVFHSVEIPQFVYLYTHYEHLVCFQYLAIKSKATINNHV